MCAKYMNGKSSVNEKKINTYILRKHVHNGLLHRCIKIKLEKIIMY